MDPHLRGENNAASVASVDPRDGEVAATTEPSGGPPQAGKTDRLHYSPVDPERGTTTRKKVKAYRADGKGSGAGADGGAVGYDKHFDADLEPKRYFQGARRLVRQARRQEQVANGILIRWYVAERRMVPILKKLFEANNIKGIDVVYTSP
ncbi:MAG TPA: hypothetical protein VEU33_09790 [Archangium sp.]|nr:hypothetical protein [Archangium sp.]